MDEFRVNKKKQELAVIGAFYLQFLLVRKVEEIEMFSLFSRARLAPFDEFYPSPIVEKEQVLPIGMKKTD